MHLGAYKSNTIVLRGYHISLLHELQAMCGKFTKLQVIWIIIFYRSVIHFCLVTLVIMEGCVCQLRMFTSKKRMLLFDFTQCTCQWAKTSVVVWNLCKRTRKNLSVGGCGLNPHWFGNILSWRLIMKSFLWSFSPFC